MQCAWHALPFSSLPTYRLGLLPLFHLALFHLALFNARVRVICVCTLLALLQRKRRGKRRVSRGEKRKGEKVWKQKPCTSKQEKRQSGGERKRALWV